MHYCCLRLRGRRKAANPLQLVLTIFTPNELRLRINPVRWTPLECAFRCNDGSCQPSGNRCNGVVDCPDAIDESHCGVCKRTEFTCSSNGACIDYLKRCDGSDDCKDGSDEQLCQGENKTAPISTTEATLRTLKTMASILRQKKPCFHTSDSLLTA